MRYLRWLNILENKALIRYWVIRKVKRWIELRIIFDEIEGDLIGCVLTI